MTPSRQLAESVKYCARPFVLIPTGVGIEVFEAYGDRRTHICTIPSAELARWLAEDLARQRSQAAAARIQSSVIPNDLPDIDFTL